MSQLDMFSANPPRREYHNTVPLSGKILMDAETSAKSQSVRILALYEKWGAMPPSVVHRRYEALYPPVPLTSIRRSITNLTTQKHLEKTGEMKTGIYGMLENVWDIKRRNH